MAPGDLADLESKLERIVTKAIRSNLADLAIDQKTHLIDHEFIGDLRKLLDIGRVEMCKSVVKWIVGVVIALILAGWLFGKSFFAGGGKP